mmetsp:Transcript_28652/g.78629  ORF Transcript_28652/g.78629 Transcript_28652/m.78629 type:complete len:233 (+) Transcript_28652:183-881(+)
MSAACPTTALLHASTPTEEELLHCLQPRQADPRQSGSPTRSFRRRDLDGDLACTARRNVRGAPDGLQLPRGLETALALVVTAPVVTLVRPLLNGAITTVGTPCVSVLATPLFLAVGPAILPISEALCAIVESAPFVVALAAKLLLRARPSQLPVGETRRAIKFLGCSGSGVHCCSSGVQCRSRCGCRCRRPTASEMVKAAPRSLLMRPPIDPIGETFVAIKRHILWRAWALC